jgi:hypothetical protein
MCTTRQERFSCGHIFGNVFPHPCKYNLDNKNIKRRHPNWKSTERYRERVSNNETNCTAFQPSFEYQPREGFCAECSEELLKGPYRPELYIAATADTPAHIRLGRWRNLTLTDAQREELARRQRVEEAQREREREWKEVYEGQLKGETGEEDEGQHLYISIKK